MEQNVNLPISKMDVEEEVESMEEEAKVKDIILTLKKRPRIVYFTRKAHVEMEICANSGMVVIK